ncbi:hypothetical protein VTK73DRAFT_2030 [Phialemonium thermophilum]|uniref:Rhodanese domain-containing protein n=1 Tax=Phialemonium thermophilum TaxID=223376 RepID=A0ABR3X6K6_9PEZI
MATIATLKRLSPTSLSELILAERDPSNPSVAIIDVRDDDHIGGHIKGSQNVPSRLLDAMMPTLVRQLQDKKTVVFHCALSQQRGPGAALRYIRERERMFAIKSRGSTAAGSAESSAEGESATEELSSDSNAGHIEQNVYVLDRGFVGWQELYGEDERLTEGYRKELWRDGYWG